MKPGYYDVMEQLKLFDKKNGCAVIIKNIRN